MWYKELLKEVNSLVSNFMHSARWQVEAEEKFSFIMQEFPVNASIMVINEVLIELGKLNETIEEKGQGMANSLLANVHSFAERLRVYKTSRQPLMLRKEDWPVHLNEIDLPAPVKVVLSDLLYHKHDENYLPLADGYSLRMVKKYLANGFTLDFDFYEIVIIESGKGKDQKYFKLFKYNLPVSYCPSIRSLRDIEVKVVNEDEELQIIGGTHGA